MSGHYFEGLWIPSPAHTNGGPGDMVPTDQSLVIFMANGDIRVEPHDIGEHQRAIMGHEIRDFHAGRRAIPSRRGCFYFIEPSGVPGEELLEVIAVYNSKEREPRGKAWRKMKAMIGAKHPDVYQTQFPAAPRTPRP